MAKTIIEEAPKKYTTRCTKCGAMFSYELSDVVGYIGQSVSCPNCGTQCYHSPHSKNPRCSR